MTCRTPRIFSDRGRHLLDTATAAGLNLTMETHHPTREDAFALLKEFNTNQSLVNHGLAVVRAAVSHGWGICVDVEPQSLLEKTLYAVDELTGLVTACALVRPSRSVMDLTTKSVRKKWKDRAFAAGVNREVIEKGAEMLGVAVDDLIADVIEGIVKKGSLA